MKFRTRKDALEKAMAKIDAIVPARDAQTLLSNVLVSISGGVVSITASDMESTVRISLEADDTESGELILPARKMSEIARKLESADITFMAEKQTGRTEGEPFYNVHLGGSQTKSARFRLSGNDQSHFPVLHTLSQDKLSPVPGLILEEMIRKTFYAISQEDNRYIYNGLAFIANSARLVVVGTDGRRLSAITRTLPQPVNLAPEEPVVVHAKAIRELQRIIDIQSDVLLGMEQRDVFFSAGNADLSSRLLEGKFPDYKKVIPSALPMQFEIPRDTLMSALSQAMVMAEPPSHQVKLIIDGTSAIMRAITPDVGDAEVPIPLNVAGESLEIAFNANYLNDILRNLECPMVRLGFNDPAKPIVVHDTDDPDFIALVMPMKI